MDSNLYTKTPSPPFHATTKPLTSIGLAKVPKHASREHYADSYQPNALLDTQSKLSSCRGLYQPALHCVSDVCGHFSEVRGNSDNIT